MISISGLKEKLDAVTGEREDLEVQLALLADGEVRLRQLEELPVLVEEYLRDLPESRTEDNPLGVYTLTPDRIMYMSDEEFRAKRLAAEGTRGARFRKLYARLGLRVAVYADGTVEITVGATNKNGVMPWNEPRRL